MDHVSHRTVEASPFARKLAAHVTLTQEDLAVLAEIYRRRRGFAVGTNLLCQGQAAASAYVIASGWAASYKMLPDGTRQIVDFRVPGDLVGLGSVMLRVADQYVEPITNVQVCELVRSDFQYFLGRVPHVMEAIAWAALRDEALVVEHLTDVGRRSAGVRMAHFLLELGSRLNLVGMATQAGYDSPLSQFLLADALGLSVVHVNRVLRDLREAGLLTFQRGRVTFDDYDGLVRYAGFDISYLDPQAEGR